MFRKPFIGFLLFLFLLSNSYPGAEASEIDLGEVFIWGDDRSVIPGLADKEFFLYPILEKDAFLDPDRRKRIVPPYLSKRLYPECPSMTLLAGLRSSDGYLLRLSGYICPGAVSYFGGYISGSRTSVDSSDRYMDRINFQAEYIASAPNLDYATGLRGGFAGFERDRYIWETSGRVSYDFGFIDAIGSLKVSGIHSDNSAITGKLGIEASRRFFYYHDLAMRLNVSFLEVKGDSRSYLRPEISYLNNMYRDLFISAGIGGGSSGNMDWNFGLSGVFFQTGAQFEIGRASDEMDIYNIYDKYLLLKPDKLYELPETFYYGGRLTRNEFGTDLSVAIRTAETQSRMIIIKSPGGAHLETLTGTSRTTAIKFSAERDALSLTARLPLNLESIPEESLLIEAEYRLLLGGIRAGISAAYKESSEVWLDSSGSVRKKAPAYFRGDLDLEYPVSDRLKLRIGGKNIFSTEIKTTGNPNLMNARYQAMLEIIF